jgi:hypothetical protein
VRADVRRSFARGVWWHDRRRGGLASVIVVIAYLYISTTAFRFGAQLDAIIHAQATGTLSGVEVDPLQRS